MPSPSACIIDGKAEASKFQGDKQIFEETADALLSLALIEGHDSRRIDIVVDCYWYASKKNADKECRKMLSSVDKLL